MIDKPFRRFQLYSLVTAGLSEAERDLLDHVDAARDALLYSRVSALAADIETCVKQVRPGVFWYAGDQMYFCQDCFRLNPECPMVKDRIFDLLYPQGGVVCFQCLENRLGHQLTLSDLTDAPYNGVWRVLLERIERASKISKDHRCLP